MTSPTSPVNLNARARTLYLLTNRQEWNCWPFLPVIRRSSGSEEFGVVFDCLRAGGPAGFSCAVWKVNLFMMPPQMEQFLMLPKEVFDTPDELADAGWVVD